MPAESVRNELLWLLLEDLEAGRYRSKEEYQRLFPGHEQSVSLELDRLHGATVGCEGSSAAGEAEKGSLFCRSDRELLMRMFSSLAFEQARGEGEGVETDPKIALGRGKEERATDSPSQELSPDVSRYRLVGELARGGMGAIFEVFDLRFRRRLAMKVALAREGEDGPKAERALLLRFLQEARVTGQLDHPSVVPVHDLDVDAAGRSFFTMKLVKGGDLRTIIELVHRGEEGWTLTRAIGVLVKVCEAVAYAHAKGVIHRDLKPLNVMVGGFGEVYVMDWGLSKVLGRDDVRGPGRRLVGEEPLGTIRETVESDSSSVTVEGTVLGTPAYMAPEQARGDVDRLDRRSDVYALGAILYHLLSGRTPFVGPRERITSEALLRRVRAGPPQSVRELAREAPPEIQAVCEKAMAREPDDRYEDVGELLEDLRAYLEGRVVRAYRTGPFAELKKWVVRNKALAASASLVLFLFIAGTGFVSLLLSSKNEEIERALLDTQLALDLRLIDDLPREADAIWPAYPENIKRMDTWLQATIALLDRLPLHQAKLEELEARLGTEALSSSPPPSPSGSSRATWLERALEKVEATAEDLEQRAGGLDTSRARELRSWSDAARHRLETEKGETREPALSRALDEPVLVEKHQHVAELVRRLELWAKTDPAVSPVAAMRERRNLARELHRRTIVEARAAWAATIESIESDYSLKLEPQIGLLPIGRDPESGLQEFAHLQTGEPPRRGDDRRLVITSETGLVFVLIPGGEFQMGAQAKDPSGSNFDPEAQPTEGPVQRVELDPFFLSKHEMTQSQWRRATGTDPSYFGATSLQPVDEELGTHPVEQVSHDDCEVVLRQLGLVLPTEAQWEYAARAGTDSPWWTGADRASLTGKVNVADRAAVRAGFSQQLIATWPELDDGYPVHTRVGSLPANGFGLHEMLGNVSEWCRDGLGFYDIPVLPGDGERPTFQEEFHPSRGGSAYQPWERARSAYRHITRAEQRYWDLGVRPARLLQR